MTSGRHEQGATLIEVVVAIVVLAIAIPPLIGLFTEVSAHGVDDVYQGVALGYADALMEEIASKAFDDPGLASAPSFRAAAESSSGPATTSHTISVPAHASGDLLVLAFAQTANGASPAAATATPAGWTLIEDVEAGDSSAVRLSVLTKVGDGLESTVAVSTATATGFGAICCSYGGATGVVDVSAQARQESGTDMTAPSVATSRPGTTVVWCFVFDDTASSLADVDSDAGFQGTLRGYAERSSPGDGLACALSDAPQSGAGATGTCRFSTNGDSGAGCAVTLALAGTAPFGPEESSRSAYDDVDDFDGMSHSPPERIDGTPLDDYGGFTRSVVVDSVTPADPDPVVPEAAGSTGLKRIRVTVAWTGGRGGEVTLATLRSRLTQTTEVTASGGPIDEPASAATAAVTGSRHLEVSLISATPEDVEIASFSLSADSSVPGIRKLWLSTGPGAGKRIWTGGQPLPATDLSLNEGSSGERLVPGGGTAVARFQFAGGLPEEASVTYTLDLSFTDGRSATIAFTLPSDVDEGD